MHKIFDDCAAMVKLVEVYASSKHLLSCLCSPARLVGLGCACHFPLKTIRQCTQTFRNVDHKHLTKKIFYGQCDRHMDPQTAYVMIVRFCGSITRSDGGIPIPGTREVNLQSTLWNYILLALQKVR